MCTAQNVSFVLFAIKWIKIANKSVIHNVRTAQFFVLVKMFTFSLLFVIKCLINCFTIIFDLVHPSPLAAHEEQQEKHSWNFNFLLLFFVFFVRGAAFVTFTPNFIKVYIKFSSNFFLFFHVYVFIIITNTISPDVTTDDNILSLYHVYIYFLRVCAAYHRVGVVIDWQISFLTVFLLVNVLLFFDVLLIDTVMCV